MSARRALASLEVPGARDHVRDLGPDDVEGTDQHVVAVRTGGTGWAPSRCGSPRDAGCGPSDARLLTALSDQAAVAFRNAAMESQLAGHVAELDHDHP